MYHMLSSHADQEILLPAIAIQQKLKQNLAGRPNLALRTCAEIVGIGRRIIQMDIIKIYSYDFRMKVVLLTCFGSRINEKSVFMSNHMLKNQYGR